MRAFIVLGLLVVLSHSLNDNNFLNFLLPNVDFDHVKCEGDVCQSKNTLLKLDRAMSSKSGLKYQSVGLGYAKTKELREACLPGVKAEVYADSFKSCENGAMIPVCTYVKRGWLVNDANNDTVANKELLKTSFSGLPGGVEAVNTCLKVDDYEEYVEEEYEFYDYSDYVDDYDYLEEKSELSRVRRGAGGGNCVKKCNGDKKCVKDCKKKTRKGGNRKKGGRSGKDSCVKKCKGDKKCINGCKKENRSVKDKKNKGKKKKKGGNRKKKGGERKKKGGSRKKEGETKKKAKGGKPNSRKYTNTKPKDPENNKKIEKRLRELGLTNVPSKTTLDELDCVMDAMEELFEDCGEKMLS